MRQKGDVKGENGGNARGLEVEGQDALNEKAEVGEFVVGGGTTRAL